MKFILCSLLLLSISPLIAIGQDRDSIQSEADLVSALCSKETAQPAIQSLIRSHPQLINSDLWTEVIKQAVRAYYSESSERSIAIYNIAIQVAAQLRDPKLLAATYYNIGRTYSGLNKFRDAIESYEKSKAYFEQAGQSTGLANVLADLGALYLIQEDYAKAREYSERSIISANSVETASTNDISADAPARARALLTLGEMDSHDGNQAEALQKLQDSLALYRRLSRQSPYYDYYVAGTYGAIGRVYPDLGDYSQALSYLSKGLEIAKARSYGNLLLSFRNDIGVVYLEQEDYEQAKAQFNEGLKICESEKNQKEQARLLLNLGVVEQRKGNYEEALRFFKLGLQTAEAIASPDFQVAGWEGIGVVLTARRDFSNATEALDKGLTIAKKMNDKTRQTELLWRMAQTHYQIGDYGEAGTLAERAVAMGQANHLAKLTSLAKTTLGESYAAQKKFDLAIPTLKEAVEQIETQRNLVAGQEEELQLFFENKVASYDDLVDLLIQQGKPFEALVYAERAKGRVLLDVLRGAKPDLAKVLTPSEKAETQRLNRRISQINDTIRKQDTAEPSSLNSLYTQLDAARVEYRSFQDALYVTHPNLRIRSGQTASLSTADLNGLAADGDTAYLEYVAAKDGVSLFVLSKNKSNGAPEVKVYNIAIKPEDLNRRVDEFHDALAEQRLAYTTSARELYTLLIAPAEQQLRNVSTICIVPDNFLWNVPFQALMMPNDHFLVEDHAVYYAPSLSVLREMNRKKATSEKTDSSLIAFGNPMIGKDEQRNADLCPLPEAEQEVNSVAKSFGRPKDSKVFIGREASEKSFKTLAPNYSVIHLATHGVIDNRQPLYSHLMLTKTEDDPDNDGRLEARRIMDMNLHADLAVLSACETANGRISPGEGVMGVSWAFFIAGTRSMLVSQWKVNSASTSELMINFYQNLESKGGRFDARQARALRQGVLGLLKDNRYHHPFYWAGFVLVGKGE
jgi:CHAT domain-containing protein